jgi:hypothetical protein
MQGTYTFPHICHAAYKCQWGKIWSKNIPLKQKPNFRLTSARPGTPQSFFIFTLIVLKQSVTFIVLKQSVTFIYLS